MLPRVITVRDMTALAERDPEAWWKLAQAAGATIPATRQAVETGELDNNPAAVKQFNSIKSLIIRATYKSAFLTSS